MPKKGNKQQRSMARGVNKANVSLKSIAGVLDQMQSTMVDQIQSNSSEVRDNAGGGSAQLIAIQVARAQLQYQKESNDYLKKINMSSNKQIEALQKSNKDWKGFGDKFKDFKTKMADAFDPTTIKKKLLGPFTMFKGVRDKMEDMDYAKRMKALGSKKTPKELKEDAAAARGAKETALRAQDKMDRLKKLGASDQQINNSQAGKDRAAALAQYNQLQNVNNKSPKDAANPMGGNTAGASAPPPVSDAANKMGGNTSQNQLLGAQAAHENQAEMLKNIQQQTDLLAQIAGNTAMMAGKRSSSSGGPEDVGMSARPRDDSRKMGGVGDALSSIGRGVGGLGKGIGQAIGGVFYGIMQGIADGIAAIGSAKTLKGIAAVGLLAVTLYGFGQALQSFSELDWDSINSGLMTIGLVVAAAALAGKFADKIVIGAGAIGILAVALWGMGKAFDAVGDAFNNFIDGFERLSKIGFDGLVGVAGGMLAISGALAAFGAGQAAAGLGTLIGNLLTIGQDSPIEQLQKLANIGDNLNGAAKGIDAIGQAMVGFSKVDKSSIDALNDFPWLRATAFVAAGGAMSVAGGAVYNNSKSNADQQAKVDGQSKGGTAVIAPTSNVSTSNQTNVIKPPVRNMESSYNNYLSRRFA
jgi:hypothetical protein